jgi:hypothetical protein
VATNAAVSWRSDAWEFLFPTVIMCKVISWPEGKEEISAKVQIGRRPVQKWKGGGREEYGVQSTEDGFGRHEVGAWLCRALLQGSARRSLAPTRERSSRKAGGRAPVRTGSGTIA